jgi:TonB family protein
MTANCSSAARAREYQLTILDTKPLLTRLGDQIAFARSEFRQDPRGFTTQLAKDLLSNKTALFAIVVIGVGVLVVIDNASLFRGLYPPPVSESPEVVLMNIGNGPSCAGFNEGGGQGSGFTPRPASSTVLSAMPIPTPMTCPIRLVAATHIDPPLWNDLKEPVYGEPISTFETSSPGPHEGEGFGTDEGVGIGAGDGPGVDPGFGSGIGGGWGQNGCCGDGSGGGTGAGGGGGSSECYFVNEVDQRPRVLSKPEPQYTEEARAHQISGTVVLRAIFASSGEVVQVRALDTLPFGLTETAIAAAREIKFVPAMKNGRPVSVYMHLEYNFSLY